MKKGITIGMDLGDKKHQVCILDKTGKIITEEEVAQTFDDLLWTCFHWIEGWLAPTHSRIHLWSCVNRKLLDHSRQA